MPGYGWLPWLELGSIQAAPESSASGPKTPAPRPMFSCVVSIPIDRIRSPRRTSPARLTEYPQLIRLDPDQRRELTSVP